MPRRRRRDDYLVDEEGPGTKEKPQQRNAANARERARMRVLSKAFCRLKTTLPWVPADTKLSKLDTLRLATSYIAHLRAILTDEVEEVATVHPLNLTWPFTFQQQSKTSSDWTGSSESTFQQHMHQDTSSSYPDGDFEDESPVVHHQQANFVNSHHHQYPDDLLHTA